MIDPTALVKPKLLLDASVIAFVGLIALALMMPKHSSIVALIFAPGVMACILMFYISLGQLAARMGKSWITWVGLSFITSPVGPIVAYMALRASASKIKADATGA
jgi:hypothetical protein